MNLATYWTGFFYVWITSMLLMLAAVIAVLIWAIRSGQFKQQNHARYLPLDSACRPQEPLDHPRQEDSGGSDAKPSKGSAAA
jgi:nitrogen fixation-related uncharacterized protein